MLLHVVKKLFFTSDKLVLPLCILCIYPISVGISFLHPGRVAFYRKDRMSLY